MFTTLFFIAFYLLWVDSHKKRVVLNNGIGILEFQSGDTGL